MRRIAILAATLSLGLSLSAQAGEVAGKVYDARGRAAAGVELVLDGQTITSGADGSYLFANVSAGHHMLVAGSQAVAVEVDGEGAVRRNVMLLSAASRQRVTGVDAGDEVEQPSLAATMRLADAMLRDGAEAGVAARRWTDIGG